MTLKSKEELEATRRKLRLLEERIALIRDSGNRNSHATELTLRSLTRLANQFEEEIARFEAGVTCSAR
jgi:hypothetical protein